MRNGFVARSRPIVVAGPWPGYTTKSSSSSQMRASDSSIARGSANGRSVRPIEPANSRSPPRTTPVSVKDDVPGRVTGHVHHRERQPHPRRASRRRRAHVSGADGCSNSTPYWTAACGARASVGESAGACTRGPATPASRPRSRRRDRGARASARSRRASAPEARIHSRSAIGFGSRIDDDGATRRLVDHEIRVLLKLADRRRQDLHAV